MLGLIGQLVRNGNAWTIYLNGKSDATATNAADAGFDSTNPLHIMRWNNSNGTMAGNVADLRFVKDTAVYTSNFTPPTAPLSDYKYKTSCTKYRRGYY